jgi:hypothetical protein
LLPGSSTTCTSWWSPILLGRGVRLLDGLEGLEKDYEVQATSSPSDLLGPLIEAGATWWDERRPMDDEVDRLEPVLRRIEAGPPTL